MTDTQDFYRSLPVDALERLSESRLVASMRHKKIVNKRTFDKEGIDMKRLVEYKLEGGQTVTVQVDAPEAPPPAALGSPWPGKKEAEITWEDALKNVKPATEAIINAIQGLAPKQYQVEFGLTFTAEAGAIIAAASAEANFKVILTWS
jgi:hypothetical protein